MPSYSQYKRQMAVMDADDANIETWITVKGNHIPIMKGQSKEEAVQAFIEKKGGKTDLTTKKGPKGETLFASKKELKNASLSNLGKDPKGIKPAILESGEKPAFRELKGTKHQGGTIGLSKEEHNAIEKQNKEARRVYRDAKSGKAAREANARPILKADEKADVSDIVKQYKADMKALGENASVAKQNKVEVNAIKEFMRRKVGAGHPYEDYYNYWLRGMSKNDSDAFNSIYGESENREKAFEALSNEKAKPAKKEKTIGEMEEAGENVSNLKQAMQHVHYGFYEERGKKMTPTQFKEFLKSEQEKNAGKNDYYANRTKQRYPEAEKLAGSVKPANKGWQNARSGHPETIGKVVRRVVKKIGEARNKNND